MDHPMFSVIVPNYNMGNFICLSIESILKQTVANFEVIIVDNCSTDSSWAEISKFSDKRIHTFRQIANLGMYANLNVAIMLARGKYIKIQCSDDILHPQCLEILSKVIISESSKEDKPLYIAHQMNVGKIGKDYSQEWYNADYLNESIWYKSKLIDNISSGLPNVCVDTQAFQKFGGFGIPNQQIDFSRDILRLGLFTQDCKCYQLDLPLVFERAHEGQSRYSLKKQWQLNEIYELYHTSGILNTKNGREKIRKLAGMHLASAFKYFFYNIDLSYLNHTLKFSLQKRLLGIIYLKSFVYRLLGRI